MRFDDDSESQATLDHYSATVKVLGDGVAVIDAEGVVRSLNPAGERVLRIAADYAVGRKVLEMAWRTVNEDGSKRAREDHPALIALRTGEPQMDVRVGLMRQSGAISWISVTAVPLDDPRGGAPIGVVASFRDVSRRRAMEIALEESRRQLDLIFNATNDIICLIAVEWPADEGTAPRFVYEAVNAAYCRLVGRDADETIGRSLDEVLTGLRLTNAREILQRAIADGETSYRGVAELARGIVVTESTLRVIDRDDSGRAIRLLAVSRDVTEQARSEEALRASEERFRTMAESLPEGVVITDLDDNALYVNDRMLELTGYSRDDLVGNNLAHVILTAEGQEEMARHNAARAAGESGRYELELVRKDGERRWVEIGGAPFRDARGEVVGTVGTVTDVTERRTVEEARAQMVGVVSHELRTPLAALTGALKLLEREVPAGEDRAGRLVQLAKRSSERMLRLVNDILELERLESAQPTLSTSDFAVAELFDQATEIVRPLADSRQIELVVEPTDARVCADADRITQVLINLIGNAIKFSPDLARVTVGACGGADGGAAVEIFVRDEGRGIPADRLSTLFKRFSQVHADDARANKGAGLGLAISRAIVEQHGGRIWAESPEAGGAVFRFTLPAAVGPIGG